MIDPSQVPYHIVRVQEESHETQDRWGHFDKPCAALIFLSTMCSVFDDNKTFLKNNNMMFDDNGGVELLNVVT